jgi:hypothetical protein
VVDVLSHVSVKLVMLLFAAFVMAILLERGCDAVSETFLNTSVALKENVFISVSADSPAYCEPDNVTITTTLENRGNSGATGNLSVKTFDSYGNEIYKNVSQATIGAGESKLFYDGYVIDPSYNAGMYTVRSNFSYPGVYRYADTSFRVKKGIGTLSSSPIILERYMKPGDTYSTNLFVWLFYPCIGADVTFNTSLGSPGNWTTLSQNTVSIPSSGEAQQTTLTISVPSDAVTGTYTGTLYATALGQQRVLNMIIHVNSSAIFDLSVSIPTSRKEVCQGDNIYATVTATKFYPLGPSDINMSYWSTNSSGSRMDMKNETVAIDTTLQRTPNLFVSSFAEPGYYTFYAQLMYNEVRVTSSDLFLVKYCPPTPPVQPSPSVGGGVGGPGVPITMETRKLLLTLSANMLVTVTGNTTGFDATVENLGTTNETVELTVDGVPSSWVTKIPEKAIIDAGSSQKYTVLISPSGDSQGIYYLNVTAFDSTKSNTETIMLIVGKNWRSAADMVMDSMESFRTNSKSILSLSCLDIADFIGMYQSAESIRQMGIDEYSSANYEKAIALFEYAISIYDKSVTQADALLNLKYKAMTSFVFPIFKNEMDLNVNLIGGYVDQKNYKEFCISYERLSQLSTYSKIVAALSVAGIICLVAVLAYFISRESKKRREVRKDETLERIRERLKEIEQSK